MKLLSLKEAERSTDVDIKMVAVRSSRYRVFGSAERIPEGEIAVADLRDGVEVRDFESRFKVLERHPMAPVFLVRRVRE